MTKDSIHAARRTREEIESDLHALNARFRQHNRTKRFARSTTWYDRDERMHAQHRALRAELAALTEEEER